MAKMEVSFYINKSPTIKVNKDLGEAVKKVSIDIPDSVDVVNPVLIIDDSHNEGIFPSEVNYMVCGAPLNRKYFITSMDYTNARRVIVAGHVDVLSTYSDRLTTTTLNYVRGAGDPTEMDDASYPISDYMIEEHFPMTTWTDIFSAEGSGRQYLLRTICSTPNTYPTHELTNGNVFCDSNLYYIRQSDDAIMYKCYQFDSSNTTGRTPSYVPRQDLTGITIIYGGDYITCEGHTWRWVSETQVGKEDYPYLNFLI